MDMSQEEMDKLMASMLGGDDDGGDEPPVEVPLAESDEGDGLTPMDLDILGEVFNVSMGAAAGAVSSLLRMKVDITTPQLTILKESDLAFKSLEPAVGVEIKYTVGVQGANIFILSQLDVMKLVNIWLGGTGQVDESEEFGEMHMSAISELMNQMMGQSSTALAGFLNTVIDISSPTAYKIEGDYSLAGQDSSTEIVATRFKFVVGDNIIDSELITTCDIGFAKSMINMAKVSFGMSDGSNVSVQNMVEEAHHLDDEPEPAPPPVVAEPPPQVQAAPVQQQPPHAVPQPQAPPVTAEPQPPTQQQMNTNQYQQPPPGYYPPPTAQQQTQPQYAQPVSFASFDPPVDLSGGYLGNMNLIKRVPLDITAEVGRTKLPVREILEEFGEGYVVELDRQASEPIDIFVNGVLIAKGTVVVVEENFGVRIDEIVSPEELIRVAGIN